MSRLLPQPAGYAAIDDATYYRQVVDHVRAVSGVRAAGLSIYEPGGAWQYDTRVAVPGREDPARWAVLAWVSPGFLDALDLPLRQGPDFVWSDTRATDRVAINARLAETLFPAGDAVGHHIQLSDTASSEMRIVGCT